MDKETLRRYQLTLQEIDRLRQARRRLLDQYQAPPVMDQPRGGRGQSDRIGDVAARREKYQRQIDRLLDDLIDLRAEIEAAIAPLTSPDRRLIRLRYVDGLPWARVARELECTEDHAQHRHGEILRLIQ